MTAWISSVISDRAGKVALFVVLFAPLGLLAWDIVGEVQQPGSRLGPDPAAAVVSELGSWSIRMLLLALAVSSIRRRFAWPRVMRYRRMIGLTAFAYVVCHFTAYLGLLASFDWHVIADDLVERTYITAGFLAMLLLVPLAVTSTDRFRRRLGPRWRVLHRAVYAAMGLALLHYFWLIKDGYAEAVLYLAVFLALMAERMLAMRIGREPRTA
jgi:sulfoxide reductase heme-binding subunit YedZ